MDGKFIIDKCNGMFSSVMESKMDELIVGRDVVYTGISRPEACKLYEEYSARKIEETVEMNQRRFANADSNTLPELLSSVETEVINFSLWLEETKGFDPSYCYYSSISLKALLIGIPVGAQIVELFDFVLQQVEKKKVSAN